MRPVLGLILGLYQVRCNKYSFILIVASLIRFTNRYIPLIEGEQISDRNGLFIQLVSELLLIG